jgi:hypothetical protein
MFMQLNYFMEGKMITISMLKSSLTRYVFLLSIIIFSNSVVAHASISWTKTFSGWSVDRGKIVKPTSDGGYIMAGATLSFGANPGSVMDILVMKLDPAGDIQWQKTYGGTGYEWANDIQQTADGGYVIVGYSEGYTLILKLTSEGNVQWQKTSNNGASSTYSIHQTKDGGFILAGWSLNNDIWVLKLDGVGNIQWQKLYGDYGYEFAHSISETSDGGFLLAGAKGVIGGTTDTWILKLDGDGAVKWQKTIGGSLTSFITSMQITADGGCVVSGESESLSPYIVYNWVFKLDTNGMLQWQKKVNSSSRAGSSVLPTPDGGYLLGVIENNPFLVKLDKDGNKLWVRGNVGSGMLESIQNTPDSGFVMSTFFGQYYTHSGDIQVLKLDSSANPSSGCGFGTNADYEVTDLDFVIGDTSILPRQNNSTIWDSSYTVMDSALVAQSICMSAQPAISVNPIYLDFSAVKLGNTSAKTITISNGGEAYLTISEALISGINTSEFKSTSSCTKIAPNGTCDITVNFTPVSAGIKAATLTVASDDPKRGTVIVPINATATVPTIAISATALNFPSVELPNSAANSITVTNTGTAELNVTSFTVLGANVAEFRISSNCSVVSPGNSCSVNVNFVPASLGAKNATLSVISDDPAKPVVSISLSGNAVDTIMPTSMASLSGTKGNNDWFVSNVLVSIAAADTGSGVKEIRYNLDNGVEQLVSGATAGFSVSGDGYHAISYRAIDNANNQVSNSVSFKIDSISPVVTGVVHTQPNANGWYNENVTVHFNATDANSGIASVTPDTIIINEGAGQVVTGTAADAAGNSASYVVSGINVDKTAPKIVITGISNGATYKLGHVPTALFTATDAISGVASSRGKRTGGNDDGLGRFTYTATATDKAGNSATLIITYTVKNSSDDED